MPPLIPCPGCSRHVYASEQACPFCEVALPRPRSLSPGLAAAAGASLALLTGCPADRTEAPVYGAPPDIQEPAPVDSGDAGAPEGGGGDEAAPAPPPDEDMRPQPLYGAVQPPPPRPAPVAPDDPGDRETAPKYGAPPPPPETPPR